MIRRRPAVGGLLALFTAAVAAGLLLGAAPIAPADVWRGLWSPDADPATATIVRSIRLPRVLVGVLTGASLGMSGALFQALLRNPLAEPYLLGVSSGAAFGAVIALTVLGAAAGPLPVAAFALAGALLAIAIVFRAARVVERVDTRVLILAGVVVSAFFGACVMLLLALARADALRSAVLWTMGSLEGAAWPEIWLLVGATLAVLGAGVGMARHLNALALGDDAAAHLGTNVELVKRSTYFVASGAAAAAVSVAGVIGFVGLVVPHAVRMVWGADHRSLVPLAAVGGAIALVTADALAQSVVRPLVLPVGVVTAIVGVPLFLVLLRRSHV